jgi:hypothetical protein
LFFYSFLFFSLLDSLVISPSLLERSQGNWVSIERIDWSIGGIRRRRNVILNVDEFLVSCKVRELDLAQSCVNSTLLRIDAIVNRSNCIEGVRMAFETEDFESAAKYVQTFLQIDTKYKASGSDQTD